MLTANIRVKPCFRFQRGTVISYDESTEFLHSFLSSLEKEFYKYLMQTISKSNLENNAMNGTWIFFSIKYEVTAQFYSHS